MMEFGACARCKQDISAERKKASLVICNHCGYTGSLAQDKIESKLEKNVTVIMLSLSAIVVAGFVQLLNWDSFSVEIVGLKVKETIGLNTTADIERTGQICLELKKYDCVETQYKRLAQTDKSQNVRLGLFQMKRAKYNEAAQSFYAFFQAGGESLEASYAYARALSQLGQVEEASKYYEQVLAARPEVLQVTVVQNYVKLLMDHQRYAQAKTLIEGIRSQSASSNMFMETEFKKIQELGSATAGLE